MTRLGIYRPEYAALVHVYSVELAQWFELSKFISEVGMTQEFRYPDGRLKRIATRPEVRIAHQSLRHAQALAHELGLTPAARRRLGIHEETPCEPDALKAFQAKRRRTS